LDKNRYYIASVIAVLAVIGIASVHVTGLAEDDNKEKKSRFCDCKVTIQDAKTEETLQSLTVQLADSPAKRYIGLSETTSLKKNEGMLFIHEEEEKSSYVMRNMAFPLDIIFIAADGRITAIKQAELETEFKTDDLTRYLGYGKYVLEVNYGFADKHSIEIGDKVKIIECDKAGDVEIECLVKE